MQYEYRTDVRDNEKLRTSFNALTRSVYGFDFIDWYERGHWGEYYIPHVLVDAGKVVSNVSVNIMQFYIDGYIKHYIQLGTVMTDPDYRGKGLNQYILEQVIKEYKDKVDGIYLFANDSVLEYYPRFGFRPSKEYSYTLYRNEKAEQRGYQLKKVKMHDDEAVTRLYQTISITFSETITTNKNDAFGMCGNLNLYQFWLFAEYEDKIYYLPEEDAYVIAEVDNAILMIYQVIGRNAIELNRLALAMGKQVKKVICYYTPTDKEKYQLNVYEEADTKLFILGEDLQRVDRDKLRFPVISHA